MWFYFLSGLDPMLSFHEIRVYAHGVFYFWYLGIDFRLLLLSQGQFYILDCILSCLVVYYR